MTDTPRARRSGRLATLITVLALVTAACTGGATSGSTATANTDTSARAPTTPFATFDGANASFADYVGTRLVVNWWASWCPSCVAELSAAFRPAQDALGDRVAFLGMNIQDDRPSADALVAETGVMFDLAEDSAGDLYLELGGLGMPFTVFIDGAGNVIEKHNGPLTEQQLTDKIEELLLS